MDFGTQAIKDVLRSIAQGIPQIHQNSGIIAQINDLLAAQIIEAIPYSYNIVISDTGAANAIAAGGVFNESVNIQADAPFMVVNQTYSANNANAAATQATRIVPNVYVTLMDTGSGAQMSDQQMPVVNNFGTGELPYTLPEPKLFTANATIQVTGQNADPATGLNLTLSFNGVKLFKR